MLHIHNLYALYFRNLLTFKKKVFILKRPNPLSGALLEPQLQSYTGGFIIQFLHG